MIEKIPTQSGARDQLLSDLKTVIQDAEAWLRHSGTLTGEEFKAAKAKVERTLVKAKDDIIRSQEAVVEKTKVAAKATDEFVTDRTVAAGTWQRLAAHLDRRELIEFCLLTSQYDGLAATMSALDIPLDNPRTG